MTGVGEAVRAATGPRTASVPDGRIRGLREAVHAEWTKQRTLSGTWWLLAAAVVLTVGLSAGSSSAVTCDAVGCGLDPAAVGQLGVEVGQAVVAVLGALAFGNEYGTGLIRVTLAAMPRRGVVVAAKVLVLAGMVFVAAVVAVTVSAVIGAVLEPGHGFTAAHGYADVSPLSGTMLRAEIGSALYLVLVALLGVGVAALVRDSAAAIGIVLGLLFLFPILAAVVSDPDWHRHLLQVSPMQAGLHVQDTISLGHQPLSPWQGLGVLAVWAFGVLGLGGLTVRFRDA